MIHIIGGGLAGCEAAWQAARLGVASTIYEMRPVRPTAVHKTDAKGTATNLLEIDHKSDPSRVMFKVNSEPVYTLDAKATDDSGVVGIRVNHNLDVHIDGFSLAGGTSH